MHSTIYGEIGTISALPSEHGTLTLNLLRLPRCITYKLCFCLSTWTYIIILNKSGVLLYSLPSQPHLRSSDDNKLVVPLLQTSFCPVSRNALPTQLRDPRAVEGSSQDLIDVVWLSSLLL